MQFWIIFTVVFGVFLGGVSASDIEGEAHAFDFVSIEGKPLPLSSFSGKVVLIVNTASKCGFTKQYAGLQELWEKYQNNGLVVLGVPSNDFGYQEPGSETEIKSFCEVNYGIDFPMTSKVRVNGDQAHPFYRWAAQQFGFHARPRWNFHKYLIAPDGRLADWFSTGTSPTSPRVLKAVERLLP